MRVERTGIRYFGLEELASAYNVKRTSNQEKLAERQKKFLTHHICKSCGEPLIWETGNVMVCKNPACKGIKIKTAKDETDEEKTIYVPSFELLEDKYADIAENLFSIKA